MKKIALLAAALTVSLPGFTQQPGEKAIPQKQVIEPYRVQVTFAKTVHILFPSQVVYVDLGSTDLIAGKVDGAENVVRIKAAVDFDGETNFSVICSDGCFYSFVATYADEPKQLSIEMDDWLKKNPYSDFANDRIIPDCIRAAATGKDIIVRNPHSTRPFQHVLEPLAVYMAVAKAQYEDGKYAGYYNVGPDDKDCVTTGQLVDLFCEAWGDGLSWINQSDGGPHEANFLKLDCSRVKRVFGWTPRWGVKDAIRLTVEWCREYEKDPADPRVTEIMDRQIGEMFQSRGL